MANPMRDQEVEPMAPPAEGQDGSKDPNVQKVIKEAKGYETVLMELMHGKKTRDQVIKMLKAAPDPFVTVPQAAMTINDMGVDMMKRGGAPVSVGAQLAASHFILDDLLQLGQACQAFEWNEEDLPALVEDAYQMYIERGLKDRSIDPIQLQVEAQKAMTEEQMAGGLVLGHGKTPQQPDRRAMIEQYADGKARKATDRVGAMQAKKEAQQKQQALGQMAMQRGEQ
jgi:hypothetical protein